MGRKITKIEQTVLLPTRQQVAAYARVSCGKDEMLHSLAAQVSYYSNLIQGKPECCLLYTSSLQDREQSAEIYLLDSASKGVNPCN